MSRALWFTVHGKAQPAGSKKAFVVKGTNRAIVTDANKNSKPWQAEVRAAAAEAMQGQDLLTGPLTLVVRVFTVPPKTVKREFPTVKPDLTKLVRGLEDALTGTVYRDDAEIVTQFCYKRYGHANYVRIGVLEDACATAPGYPDER